jgi:hypothetical protein
MHSIKNTVIAVGLLGLSFLFYQASSNKDSDDNSESMVPAFDLSGGLDDVKQLAANSMDAVKSKVDSVGSAMPSIDMPKIDMPEMMLPQGKLPKANLPDLSKSKQLATDFAADMGRTIKDSAAPLKEAAQNFSQQAANQFAPTNSSPRELQIPPIKDLGGNDFSAKPVPTNPIARDEGLITALGQSQPAQNQFAGGGSFGTPEPTQPISTAPNNSNDFAADSNDFSSQPIPNNDSSFNKLATDESSKRGSVVHADSQVTAHLDLQSAWPQVEKLSNEKKFRDALRLLSRYYRSNDLTGPQRQRLIPWLDSLAGKVIFSDEHHLQPMPYTVANESLVDIGKRWRVPGQLIYNINRKKIPNPAVVPPGTQLKMVQGPFNAEIDTEQNVMTLFLDDLYAGRFRVRMGISGTPQPGSYQVLVKSAEGHNWRDAEGNDYPPGTSENGYGPDWIGLSGKLCIHAVGDSVSDGHRGCIGLNAKDAKDVFAILTEGSNVKILR